MAASLLSIFSLTSLVAASTLPLTLEAPTPEFNTSIGLSTQYRCLEQDGRFTSTTKADCEAALDRFVQGRPMTIRQSFSNQGQASFTTPIRTEYETCKIDFSINDNTSRVLMTLGELYGVLMGPNGVIKQCLGPTVPYPRALGGATTLGSGGKLIALVVGQGVDSEMDGLGTVA